MTVDVIENGPIQTQSVVDSNLRLILIILEHSSTTESSRTSLVLGSDEEKHSEADSGQTDERVEVTGRDSVRPFVHWKVDISVVEFELFVQIRFSTLLPRKWQSREASRKEGSYRSLSSNEIEGISSRI